MTVRSNKEIDILCVVDGQSLFDTYFDPTEGEKNAKDEKNPYRLTPETAKKYCRMIARQPDVEGLNAVHDLTVRAKDGDQIWWRAVSLTNDLEYKVQITGFHSIDPNTAPEPEEQHDKGSDVWMTTVSGKPGGRDDYYLYFTVRNPLGKLSYFEWDPYILIYE